MLTFSDWLVPGPRPDEIKNVIIVYSSGCAMESVKPVESIISSSGMLPNAVLPPSLDHNYAQWQEREDNGHTEQPPLMKKIIPAPKPKGPGEPDSPTPLHPPTPPALSKDVSD